MRAVAKIKIFYKNLAASLCVIPDRKQKKDFYDITATAKYVPYNFRKEIDLQGLLWLNVIYF